jgi:hypothetical protein
MPWILLFVVSLAVAAVVVACFIWDVILPRSYRHRPWSRRPLPDLPIDTKAAESMGLELWLARQGLRLYWGEPDKLEDYLRHGDYEMIEWTESSGKTWLLTPVPGGPVPLQTRHSPEALQEMEKARDATSADL